MLGISTLKQLAKGVNATEKVKEPHRCQPETSVLLKYGKTELSFLLEQLAIWNDDDLELVSGATIKQGDEPS